MNTPSDANDAEPQQQKDVQVNGLLDSPRPSTTRKPLQRLCHDCKGLQIAPESFVIAKTVDLFNPRQAVVLRSQPHGKGRPLVSLRSGTGDVSLPNLGVLAERKSTCNLCSLIVDTVYKLSIPALNDDAASQTTCSIRWEVDGHDIHEGSSSAYANRTRRLRFMWKSPSSPLREAFLVFVARTGSSIPNSDVSSYRRKDRVYLGREIDHEKGKQALLKSWLNLCRKNHGPACRTRITQMEEFGSLLDETYFGVIDVVDMQLKPLPRNRRGRAAKYAALSYVWGRPQKQYATTRANAPWRREHGGLELEMKKFPKAIRDTIKLVQKLGIRYLWVDALCIVQDSPTSFRLNAQAMHTIYGNAFITICSADGIDAQAGLVAMDDVLNDMAATAQVGSEIVPGVRLQVCRPPEMVIEDSKWNTRAWTFQERILSRRCVIFAENRAYFQCRKAAMSEDIHNEISGSGWSLQTMGAPLRYFAEIESRSLSFYMKSVSMFYRRELTRAGDVLAAYKGIESILQKVMRAPFCFGLPTSHFDFALLWQPLKAGRRRVPTLPKPPERCTQGVGGTCNCCLVGDDFGGLEFPSWSWSGWVGGHVGYDSDALEGTLLNVQEWLREHTWIRWYIRDGRGRLRPLWQRDESSQDISLESRWRGYAGMDDSEVEDATTFASQEDSSDEADSGSDEGMGYGDPEWKMMEMQERRKKRMQKVELAHLYAKQRVCEPGEKRFREGYGFLRRRKPQAAPMQFRAGRRRSHVSSYSSDKGSSEEETYEVERRGPKEVVVRRARGYEDGVIRDGMLDAASGLPLDSWGRPSGRLLHGQKQDVFSICHPETPWRVRKTEFTTNPPAEYPDMPILQFWTHRMALRVVKASEDEETGLSRCHVADSAGDWCGTVVVATDWINKHDGELFDFIAISEAKAFTVAEHPIWNYYVPRERSESEWDIYHALLIQRNNAKHVWERVGLGKVFKNAFNDAGWDEIMLG